jgi:hypothetical protein
MTIAGLPESIRKRLHKEKITSKSTLLEVARQFDDAAMHEHLDILISGGKKPTEKRKQPSLPGIKPSEPVSAKSRSGSDFVYQAGSGEVELHAEFAAKSNASRSNVLKALKEAFDAVKSGSAKV